MHCSLNGRPKMTLWPQIKVVGQDDGTGYISSRGVFRFESFEEAEAWRIREAARCSREHRLKQISRE